MKITREREEKLIVSAWYEMVSTISFKLDVSLPNESIARVKRQGMKYSGFSQPEKTTKGKNLGLIPHANESLSCEENFREIKERKT